MPVNDWLVSMPPSHIIGHLRTMNRYQLNQVMPHRQQSSEHMLAEAQAAVFVFIG
jgi:hypothetical protein